MNIVRLSQVEIMSTIRRILPPNAGVLGEAYRQPAPSTHAGSRTISLASKLFESTRDAQQERLFGPTGKFDSDSPAFFGFSV